MRGVRNQRSCLEGETIRKTKVHRLNISALREAAVIKPAAELQVPVLSLASLWVERNSKCCHFSTSRGDVLAPPPLASMMMLNERQLEK